MIKPGGPLRRRSTRLRSAERVLGLQRALIQQADTDHLTQLLNRRALMRRAQAMVEAASVSEPLGVMQIDIDHFKSINDRCMVPE